MYKWNTNVRYSECGEDGTLKLLSMINYFQDSSSAHSEALGVGMEYLKEKKRAWILNSWQIVIERLPEVHEEIEVTTWPTGFKGVFGPRNFCMRTPEGEMLAYANTLWVYMDLEKGKPTKPDEEEREIYGEEPPMEMEYASRKITLPGEASVIDTVPVCRYHIDTNGHMNNGQYVQIAAEALSEKYSIKQIRVEYKKSAMYGDQITIKRAAEEGRVVVELCDQEEKIYAVVEFTGEE